MDLITAHGQRNNTNLVRISKEYHFFVWVVLAIAIIGITISSINSNPGKLAHGVVVIVCLLFVYSSAVWIWQKL